MHHQEFMPSTKLQDAIKCFWYDRVNVGEQQPDFVVMPDGYAEIIFYFGGDCSIVQHDALVPLPSPFIMGLLDQPARLHTKNELEIIAVRCYPWTVFDLLGLQPATGDVHVFEHPVARLQSVLSDLVQAGNIAAAAAHVQQFFLDARSHIAADSLLHKAGAAMIQANGTMPVSEVAEAAHATVRTLERRFKQSSGHSVKNVSGLMRFEQARNHLWTHPDANLAGLAHELGYTDQSHLSREFKRYSGTTPAAFARKTRKAKQALGNDFVAFVQA